MRKRRPNTGLVRFWVRLRKKGYTRSIAGLYRCMKRLGLKAEKAKKPAYKPKPYEQATFPGQKVQIDVKVVPSVCIVGQAKEQGEKMYQYTAIDECTRFRFIAAFKEQSTYSSMRFLQQLIRRFPFKIHIYVQLSFTICALKFFQFFIKPVIYDSTLFLMICYNREELSEHSRLFI